MKKIFVVTALLLGNTTAFSMDRVLNLMPKDISADDSIKPNPASPSIPNSDLLDQQPKSTNIQSGAPLSSMIKSLLAKSNGEDITVTVQVSNSFLKSLDTLFSQTTAAKKEEGKFGSWFDVAISMLSPAGMVDPQKVVIHELVERPLQEATDSRNKFLSESDNKASSLKMSDVRSLLSEAQKKRMDDLGKAIDLEKFAVNNTAKILYEIFTKDKEGYNFWQSITDLKQYLKTPDASIPTDDDNY